jgi:outer membrane autotransporter protein
MPVFAASTTISTTTTPTTTTNLNASTSDSLTVTSSGSISSTASPAVNPAVSLTVNNAANTVSVTNSGLIEATATGARGIRFVNSGGILNANITVTNNVGGIIQSQSDAVQSNPAFTAGTILIDNAGIIRSTGLGANNGQAIDLNNIIGGGTAVTITNRATGLITAADADAIRAANNTTINNFGQIISNIGTAANGSVSGNDAIDFNDVHNTGTVNNFSTGLISSARHGITGSLGITVNNSGTIIGNDGSGINIDSTTNASITTVTNSGTIIGTAKTADGDGIDVDRLLTLNNYGTIKGLGIASGGSLSEGLAIGGGTVNNYAGGLIYSDQRAITVDDSNLGNAFATVDITNAGTIQGASGEAIKITSNLSNTLTNSGTIIGSVFMGNATGGNFNTVTILPGSKIVGLVDGGSGTADKLVYSKVGLTLDKETALALGQTVNIGGTLYTGFEVFTGSTVKSFSSFATNPQTLGIANILDNQSTTQAVSASTQTLIDQIASSSNPGAAMAQLTPTAFQSLTAVGISGAFQTTQVVDQRLSTVRDGGLAFDNSGLGTAMALLNNDYSRSSMPAPFDPSNPGSGLAYAQAPAQDPALAALAKAAGGEPNYYKAPRMVEGDTPWGMFLYGNAVFAHQKATATAPESRFTATGVTGGIDRRVAPDLVLGLLGGFSRTNADLDTLGSTSKISTWLLGTYGTYYRQNWFVNGAFVYGRNSYDNNRIALSTANVSNPKGGQYALQGSVGVDLRYGLWIVTPELGAQYTTVRVDGFTETGAAALNVAADQTNSLRSSLGARVRYDLQTAWGRLTPEWRASWQHEFMDKDRDVRASFVDQALPGTFSTTAAGAGTDFGVIGAGINAAVADRTQVSLGYDFKFGGQDFTAHQISGRVRHVF